MYDNITNEMAQDLCPFMRTVGRCTENEISACFSHNERLRDSYASNEDIILDKKCDNYSLITYEKPYMSSVADIIDNLTYTKRKNTIVLVDGLVHPNHSKILFDMSKDEQKEFFNHALEFFTERFNRENFLSAVVHMDEYTPHLHFVFVPLYDGRLCYSKRLHEAFGEGRMVISNMNSDFISHMKRYYPYIRAYRLGNGNRYTEMKDFKLNPDMHINYNLMYDKIQEIGVLNSAIKKEEAMDTYREICKDTEKKLAYQERTIRFYEEKAERTDEEIRGKDVKIGSLIKENNLMKEELDAKRKECAASDTEVKRLKREVEILRKYTDIVPHEFEIEDRKEREKD